MSTEKPSVCPLDCPDTCSLSVTVADEQVIAVRGSKANPLTHGAICAKVARYYPEFVHGLNRLRYPYKRIGAKGEGQFSSASAPEHPLRPPDPPAAPVGERGDKTINVRWSAPGNASGR